MESLFNSEYFKIFKSTYFEKHLQTAASENLFMKLRKKRLFIRNFYIHIIETSENVCFYFMKETSEFFFFFSVFLFLILKAHWQISKERCFEKYYSCNKACQFSAFQGTPWWDYLENPTIDDKFINKFLYIKHVSKTCWEKKILGHHNNYICNITVLFHRRNKWKYLFLFHDWFPLDFVFRYNISLVRNKLQTINIYLS